MDREVKTNCPLQIITGQQRAREPGKGGGEEKKSVNRTVQVERGDRST